MRTFPHHPKAARLAESKQHLALWLDRSEKTRKDELAAGNGAFSRLLAEQRILQACLAYSEAEPDTQVVKTLREATGSMSEAIELGYRPDAWDVWNFFLSALATGDRSSAQLLASLPEDQWGKEGDNTLLWLTTQVLVVTRLLRHQQEAAGNLLGVLYDVVHERPLPEGVQLELPEIKNTYQLLKDLHEAQVGRFNQNLHDRMRLRETSFAIHGMDSPLGLLDLPGLGLCRLARDRGIDVTVEHVYLPLELLAATRS